MRLHGYLSTPAGHRDRPLPSVLHVHGGPWARDDWGYDDMMEFLVNRGYAVLQLNYGSRQGMADST